MNIKDLFDEKKRESLLQDAVRKARTKKDGEFPFAFALMAKKEALLVIDRRAEFNSEKMLKQIRKQKPRKMIVGTAAVNGKVLELTVAEKKGTIKAKDVRDFLNKNGLAVNKAVIIDKKQNSAGPAAKETNRAAS